MKILWVEDFDKIFRNDVAAINTKSWFGNFISNIEEKLDRLEKKEEADRYNFIRILASNDNPIYWCDGFLSGIQAIDEGIGKIENKEINGFEPPYDFIILDAGLPFEDTPLSANIKLLESNEYFKKKGVLPQEELETGFSIYNYLIFKKGFPADRIVFLSAHATQASKIKEKFEEIKAPLPVIIEKNSLDDANNLQTWLCENNCIRTEENKELHDFLALRRGILDTVKEVESQKDIQLTESFGDETRDPIKKDVFLDTFNIFFKDHKIPIKEDERSHFYLMLCDYLTKPFERFEKWKLFRGIYEDYDLEEKEYVIPAYMIRNLIAHRIIENKKSQLEAQDVGFIFITILKCMFDYNCYSSFKPIYPYSNIDQKQLVKRLMVLQTSKYNEENEGEPAKPVLENIFLKGFRRRNNKNELKRRDLIGHMYSAFLFSCVTPSGMHIVPAPSDDNFYFVGFKNKLIEKNEAKFDKDIFEKLKSVAYHRQSERNFI